jgi:hypothetical protein
MREWKDEYAKIYEDSVANAEKNHAVAMELFSRLEEYFVGAEQDFQQFEDMLKGVRAEVDFCLRQGERRMMPCANSFDLFNKGDGEGTLIPHDYFHYPVLTEHVWSGLQTIKQFNELPDHTQMFLERAITSLIRDQIRYWNDLDRCYCETCEADYQKSKKILASSKQEET